MPSGGAREGTPGKAYGNRTDLNAPKQFTPKVGPSQQYGQGAALLRAQQAVPMGNPGVAPPAAALPAVPANTPMAPPPALLPGQLPPLDRPSERPNEPVTAGAPAGAGPGPEALGLEPPSPQMLGDLLGRLAQQNPDLAYLASVANGGSR